MQIISWNCRGLGNPMNADAVKDLLKMELADIFLLQETKIEKEASLSINISKWKNNVGMAVSARGTSGGLTTLWFDDKFLLKTMYGRKAVELLQELASGEKEQFARFNVSLTNSCEC